MRVVVPGGTGFLGRALSARLTARGDEVVVLTRGRPGEVDGVRHVHWDASTVGDWAVELEGADAIVHLTGRRVSTRTTRRAVDELISSRVGPVRAVGAAIRAVGAPPPVWVQSSSLAIFGDGGDVVLDESATPSGIGPREMVTVCLAWEGAFAQAAAPVGRTVLLRMGIAFGGYADPATAALVRLVRLGLGGTVGSGRQWVSWIGLDDLLAVLLRALDDCAMRGTYHATSPWPVTNAELMAVARRVLGRRVGLPAPALATRLGAPLMGSSANLVLTGRRCAPARLLDEGFEFTEQSLEAVLRTSFERAGASVRTR